MDELQQHRVNLFVDLRGFTAWSEALQPSLLGPFMARFYALVAAPFPAAFVKTLGDGAMILCPAPVPPDAGTVATLLADVLRQIALVEAAFGLHCATFAMQYGTPVPLRLGWGVTRGLVTELHCDTLGITDYVGVEINKASRLCSLARPAGIVIDAADFPDLPERALLAQWLSQYAVASELLVPTRHRIRGLTQALHAWVLRPQETSP